MKLQPTEDRVIVELLDPPQESAGGILLLPTAQERVRRGRVLSVGPGRMTETGRTAVGVHEGDEVLVGQYAGTEVELDGRDVLVCRSTDVLGVLQ